MPCPKKLVKIHYAHQNGDCTWRTVEPLGLYYGTTEQHPEPQWLLRAFDLGDWDERHFAVKRIQNWGRVSEMPAS